MTAPTPPDELDDLRRGLSLSDEVRLLVSIRTGWSTPTHDDHGLAPSGNSTLSTRLQDRRLRAALAERLTEDLLERPLFAPIHDKWLETRESSLPMYMRPASKASLAGDPKLTGWLGYTIPPLSGRLRRTTSAELGSLVALPSERQEPLWDSFTLSAILLTLSTMNPRERAVNLASLGKRRFQQLKATKGPDPAALPDGSTGTVARHLQRNLALAAYRACDPDHLFVRFRTALAAICFSPPYRCEATTLAYVWPPRDGQRLLRYSRRQHRDLTVSGRALRAHLLDLLKTHMVSTAEQK